MVKQPCYNFGPGGHYIGGICMEKAEIKKYLQTSVDMYYDLLNGCKKELEEDNGNLLPVERYYDRTCVTIYTSVIKDLQQLLDWL